MWYGLIFIAVSLTALAVFKREYSALLWGGFAAWFIFGTYSYTLSTALWDIYYATFWLGMLMAFVCLFRTFDTYRNKRRERREREESEGEEDAIDEYSRRNEEYQRKMDKVAGSVETDRDKRRRKRRTADTNLED